MQFIAEGFCKSLTHINGVGYAGTTIKLGSWNPKSIDVVPITDRTVTPGNPSSPFLKLVNGLNQDQRLLKIIFLFSLKSTNCGL